MLFRMRDLGVVLSNYLGINVRQRRSDIELL
jgi:hypothetical protein